VSFGFLEKTMKANKAFVISSHKDAAYQSARSGETMAIIASWILEKNPAFLDSPTDEEKAQLRDGWAVRWQELNPSTKYTAEWVPSEKGGIEVTLAYCLSYSQQAFGQLKNENPVQHGVIKQIRDAFNKYCSNRMSDLRTAVRRVANDGNTATRSQAKIYTEFLSDMFDTAKARCKTAKARGDSSAPDEVVLRQAIDAFYAKLK
jgi:hypothetical protein